MEVFKEGGLAYEVVERKCHALDILIHPIEEVVHGERIRFVDILGTMDWLEHWSNNDIGVNDCEVKGGLLGSDEVPCGLFSQLLCYVIAK